MNSFLLDYYLKSISSSFSGGYYAYNKQYIEQLPICIPDFSNRADASMYERVVTLVESILRLHSSLATINNPTEKQIIQRQIETTDKQIDALVYNLYGLTEDEIRIVGENWLINRSVHPH